MSDISSKMRNNPNSFAKPAEVIKEFTCYSLNQRSGIEVISPPKKPSVYCYGGRSGVPLYYDKEKGKIYVDQTDKHTLVVGATASKKSRLIAMPTVRLLGAARESMIICDPKAEIYTRTASYLQSKGYDIKILNMRTPKLGSAWNPLDVPYQLFLNGDINRAYEFVNDIAVNLTNMEKSNKEAFWDNSAGSLFFGLILLLFKFCKEYAKPNSAVNIGNIFSLRNTMFTRANQFTNNPLWRFAKEDPFIVSTLIGTVETANETRAGILSVFDQKMRAFAIQPLLLDMLSFNDIDYGALTNHPTAFYLILPDEKTGYHGLVSLFVKQSYEFLIHLAQDKFSRNQDLGIRVNYILDEFSSLPTINDFSAMITAARSRNVRFNLFLQSKHQLRLRYGDDSDTIMSNCENWIFLASRELDFLREVSELCGDCGANTKRPLLSVSDLQRFDKDKGEALLLCGRNKPMITYLADISYFDRDSPKPMVPEHPVQRARYKLSFEEVMNRKSENPDAGFIHAPINFAIEENLPTEKLLPEKTPNKAGKETVSKSGKSTIIVKEDTTDDV